jgi:hypothetical protein
LKPVARAHTVAVLAVAGDGHQQGVRRLRVGAQAPRQLGAVHVGQADIEQTDLGPELGGARQCIGHHAYAVVGYGNPDAVLVLVDCLF